ncbi:MAG: S46 family peptidase [Planctomycetaceae bacterium]
MTRWPNRLRRKKPGKCAAELVQWHEAERRGRTAIGRGMRPRTQSTDPMIPQLARLIDEPSRAARKKFDTQVVEAERQAYAQISKRCLREGANRYPDATFTLRLSYGTVKGYEENGKFIKPWITAGGAFEHAAVHGNKRPGNCRRVGGNTNRLFNLETLLNLSIVTSSAEIPAAR